jgi:outer membrane protein insertion porin family
MACRIHSSFGILVVFGVLASGLGYAQSLACVDDTTPPRSGPQETKITIKSVEFEPENPLFETLRLQSTKEIQQQEIWVTPDEGDSDWVNRAIQPIRDALRDQGYFKTSVEATPYLIRALPAEKFYILRVAIDAGQEYYLGKLGFVSADADGPSLVFAEDLLRQQIPLKEGELFDVSKIRNGLEALGKLYGSQGFIDATPEPNTSVNDETSRVDLVIRIDQQKRYRIGRIEFLGLNAKTASETSLPQESGDFFNRSLWDSFFEAGKSKLQPNSPTHEGVRLRRNPGDGTVDVILGFRACPKAQTPAN